MWLGVPPTHMSRSRTRGAEVQGRALDAVVTAVATLAPATRMRVQTILADEGVLHVSASDWYPLGDYLDTLDAIESAVGSSVLRRVGMQLPVVSYEAVDATDPSVALVGLDDAYAASHRGERAGSFEFERCDASTGRVVSTTPYPDHFDRGLLESTLAGRDVDEVYARVTPSEGFGEPSTATTYDVQW